MATKSPSKQLMLSTISFVAMAVILIFTITLAWFAISDQSSTGGMQINVVGRVNIGYELYYYVDPAKKGTDTLELVGNTNTTSSPVDNKWWRVGTGFTIGDPDYAESLIAPGDKMTFCLVLTNLDSKVLHISANFSGIFSFLFGTENQPTNPLNRVERAYEFSHRETKYGNSTFTGLTVPGVIGVTDTFEGDTTYEFVSNIVVSPYTTYNSAVMVFFNLYFRPDIYGWDDALDEAYTDSNIFKDQVLKISYINIVA